MNRFTKADLNEDGKCPCYKKTINIRNIIIVFASILLCGIASIIAVVVLK